MSLGTKTDFKILHSNCQGFISKQASIEQIVKNKSLDVYLCNETALKGKRKICVKDYFSFCNNREKHMGGVATVVSNHLRPFTVKVAEGREGDEYIVTRYDHINPPINIINIYGAQEKGDIEKGKKENVLEGWNRLLYDMKEIENRGEGVILIGDMNRAIGAGKLGVEGNKQHISYGGQLIRDLLATNKYVLLNSQPMAEGGVWTWVDRSNPSVKSCLDLGIVSAGLLPFVTTFRVDSTRAFTPMRVRKNKKSLVSTYSDHFAIEVVLQGLPRAGVSEGTSDRESCTWNLRKEGGWQEYKEQTEKVASIVEDIIKDDDISIEECMTKTEKVNNKVKFTAFGKTRKSSARRKSHPSQSCTDCGRLEEGPGSATRLERDCTKCMSDSDKLNDVLQNQAQRMEDEINEVKKTRVGRLARVFKMKQKIVGSKKAGQEPTAIKDPESGDLLVSGSEIRKASLNYCINNLKNNPVAEKVKVIVHLKEKLHAMRMKKVTIDEFDIETEEYKEVVKRFTAKDTKSYDFLIKADEKYQEAMGNFIKRMIKKEEFPSEFRKTTLQMLWKGKGPAEVLKNSRFLHMKSFVPRACEAVVVGRMKEQILKSSSIFQVGEQPGHSTDESIFVIKSLMAMAEKSGKS